MTVQGATVVQVIAPTREQQLERELVDCYAALELKQAQLEAACAGHSVDVLPPRPTGEQEVVALGGGFVAEADGWLWLVWRGEVRRLGRAEKHHVEHADAVRAVIARQVAERKAFAS